MTEPSFIHLRVHSTYSLLNGALHIGQLADLCQQHNMPALAISDHNNMFGSLEFSTTMAKSGIQPIVGAVLSFAPAERNRSSGSADSSEQLLLLAQNETGYKNLLQLVSKSYLEPAGEGAPLLDYADLDGRTTGIIALSSGIYGGIGKRLLASRDDEAKELAQRLAAYFPGGFYIELMRHGMEEERQTEAGFITLAHELNLPLVASNDVYFATPDMYEAHDALICIAEGRYISEENRRRLTPHHHFKSPEEMCRLFADIPEALANTVQIARRCAYMSPQRAPILPSFGDMATEAEMLRRQAREGLQQRLAEHVFKPEHSTEEKERIKASYSERLEFELDTIINMKFPGYFLIVSDFIKWSKEQNIPVGPGRGSGAGSLVAWSLLITDLDPIRYGLLFERFLNPERVSMPDFDIDFCQEGRDRVIHYVQGKYGEDHVAQIITFGKLQARAVLRDVGRVLQMPYGQVDKICKLVPNNPANPVTLQQAIEMEPLLRQAIADDEMVEKMVNIALKLEGLNRHASTHAAGVVIGDRPLVELVPLYRDPRSEMLVVQYSMKYAESAGLVKFDFLGLKTLTVLDKCLQHLRKRNIEIDLLQLPEGDKTTYEMLGQGSTTGVFQLESAGMRDTLRKLKPDCIEDIIALVSLYRPGPMDNIPTYIARKHGREKPEYLHPTLENILKETFGVIIYQEQVMQIAQELAGYSLGEADLLRRAMGKKIHKEMEAQREIFVSRAVERGVAKAQAKSIFELIAKFASYGFNKSHAAAYALIAYQTAYLKANYPVEFLAASMTLDMQNTDKLSVFKEDAAQQGIVLLPPDINHSQAQFSVEEVATAEGSCKRAIRYGLAALKNVGEAAMQSLVEERNKNGKFKHLVDFITRVDASILNRRQLEYMVKAGAFDSLHDNRRQLFEALDILIAFGQSAQRERESNQVSLFADAEEICAPPPLPECSDWEPLTRAQHEFSAVGFYLSSHPLRDYADKLQELAVTASSDIAGKLGSSDTTQLRLAGIVTGIKYKTSERGRYAFLQLSDESGIFEASIFDETLLTRHAELLENGKLLLCTVEGKKNGEGETARLIVRDIKSLDDVLLRQQQKQYSRLTLKITGDRDGAKALPEIKNLLGEPTKSGIEVRLQLPLVMTGEKGQESYLLEMRLPGNYSPTLANIGQLQRFQVMTGI